MIREIRSYKLQGSAKKKKKGKRKVQGSGKESRETLKVKAGRKMMRTTMGHERSRRGIFKSAAPFFTQAGST